MSFYTLLRSAIGIVHLGVTALLFSALFTHSAVWVVPAAAVNLMAAGLFLHVRLTPKFLRRPRGTTGAILALSTIAGTAMMSFLVAVQTTPVVAAQLHKFAALAPSLVVTALMASLLLPIALYLLNRPKKAKKPAAAEAGLEDDMLAEDLDDLAEDYDDAPAQPAAPRRPLMPVIHRAAVSIFGIGVLTLAAGILLKLSRDPGFGTLYEAFGVMRIVQGAGIIGVVAGLTLLLPRFTPGFVGKPSRWVHVPAVWIYLAILGALAPILMIVPAARVAASQPETIAPLAAHMTYFASRLQELPGVGTAALLLVISAVTILVTTPLTIRARSVAEAPDALRPYSSQTNSEAAKDAPKRDLNKGKLPEPKLPSIGAAMKLYIIADWLVMRLLGLGMLGTGYILWNLMAGGRDYQAVQISYGLQPFHALVIYCTIGALMTVPFLLPRFITAPRNVVGGLFKAILLVATAFILLPMVHVGIDMFTPEIYHATLHTTVPNLFKAIAAVAVTSALLISFFRQLGRTPQTDYLGKPVMILTEKELRDLREARMDG